MSGEPELWGGFECSIVRIGNAYRDQFRETGHLKRPADIEAAASLGLKKVRYPILWEAVCPNHPEKCRWEWIDQRLTHIRQAGLGVIAGLSHHGSGPRYTNLLDPGFPDLFAAYAAKVARRYPWLTDFTPINEPLTTARFSCLYGHWYPHKCTEEAFLRSLFIQCRATHMAMQAVRTITPHARLIQTEDLGRVFGVPSLEDQINYENERRWLSFDLLVGRVQRQHPFFDRFLRSGISEKLLLTLTDDPCPPDVLGINHYLTSDRYLDDDSAGYPTDSIGGNGSKTYADIAAVRVPGLEGQTGFESRLREAWSRYGRPLALTEVHNGCTREEQVRWLCEAWAAATKLRDEGIPIEGFTVWSLVGTVDWTSMLTERRGDYETGAFDIRSGQPRPTALAAAIRQISKSSTHHPVVEGEGWWKRPQRYHRPVNFQPVGAATTRTPILITGRKGTLGQAFSRICEQRDIAHVLLGRDELDIAVPASVEEALQLYKPWAIINAAGFVRVAEATQNKDLCMRDNGTGAAVLAAAAADIGIRLATFSSDLVFDGKAGRPYLESDRPTPQCVYGHSKAIAERDVLLHHESALVVRTSAFFGPWDRYNFAWAVVQALTEGKTFEAKANEIISPTFVPDLVNATLDLLIDESEGLWHVSNDGEMSWYDFARQIASAAGKDASLIRPNDAGHELNTSLGTVKGIRLPSVENAVARFAKSLE